MKRILASVACAIALSLCLGSLIGCGGSSTTPPPPPPTTYALTVDSTNPASGVAITVSPADNNSAGNGTTSFTRTYNTGTSVTLTAPATSGSDTFSSWTGCSSAVTVTCTVSMNSNTTVTANYAAPPPVTYSLTVDSTNPASGVAITVSPADNNSAGNGTTSFTRTYNTGTSVTLTAPATSGSNAFSSWTGCTSVVTVTCTVSMTANTTVTANYATSAPTITSFAASASTITAGGSDNLTAVFAGGTGVITPGNLAVTSGTPVSVSPTTTTTYTLTVTPTVGAAITATAGITVDPAPAITSFVANPTSVGPGGSSNLTGVFANGSGVVTPGNLPVTSGTPLSVSPTATTTYTLTVTNPIGSSTTMTATVTYNASGPAISSFTANPTTIAAGASSSLTADFTNGTGVIAPGNLAVTSGTPVSVSPATTTIYTLTVTPTTGPAVTGTATVTVDPAPTITSFGASPATIALGTSASLTAVFANGTGVVNPGNHTVTSGTALSVSPTTTTIYTLTVTPPLGTAITQTTTVSIQSSVTVNPSNTGAAVTDQILGMNMAAWYDVVANDTGIVDAFQAAGIKAIRWPGGSWSDAYNWETNTECGSFAATNNTFANFVSDLAIPAGLDVALTADYGTGKNCTGPGDPTEAASWAAAALTDGITVSHITVGNEEYGTWETDNHTLKNNAATYAAATAGTSGYYALIKAASPSTLVGVSVNPGNSPLWDPTVLANAPYDFVEYHYYPETPGAESDTFLVQQGAAQLTADINTIKSELTTAGKPNTPIYVGEIGGAYSNPGKQSWSITQGLYTGEVLGEMMNDGVTRLTWWIGFGNCNGTAGNDSASLYGWQDFGAYNVFSDGPSDGTCPDAGPIGTMSPSARAFQLFSNVAVNGEFVLTPTTAGDTTNVVAYAATHSGGTALVLFNRNENASAPVTITVTGLSSSTGVTVETYDKAIYDLSGSPTGTFPDPVGTNTWAAPTTVNLGAQTLPLTLTLAPWSMNVVIIQ
jgi:Divergent InlB B-repeat domain